MLSDLSVGERSGRVIVRSGKGNEARTVPLNASARLALAVYLAPQWEFVEKKYRDPIYTQRSAHFAVIWHVVSFRQKYTDRPTSRKVARLRNVFFHQAWLRLRVMQL